MFPFCRSMSLRISLLVFCQVPKLNKELFSPSTYRKELFQNKDSIQAEGSANKENNKDGPNNHSESLKDEPTRNKISHQEAVGITTSIPMEESVATTQTQTDKLTASENPINQEPIVYKEWLCR